ncbi:WcaG [Stenotrophomonas phage vB_SmaS_DLP_3]|nr:WcaG [Stenotrophomonas phage vB_SmaS_DLP_3]
MRVAITGGTGFIGTNLTKYLMENEPDTEIVLVDLVAPCIELGPKVKYIYADIRNLKSLLNAFEGCDEVYNLAGILGTSELLSISSLACETNITGACNVFDACVEKGVKRVYNVAKPHFEGYAENAYTLTKHAGELLGLMYRKQYGLDVATVRWLNAVGPYQHLYPVRKFLPMMILQAFYGYNLEVYGSGKQTIDPIDTRDLARFTLHACRNLGQHKEVVDLGSGRAISCNDAAELILKLVKEAGIKTDSKVIHVPMRPGEADDINLCADTTYWDGVGMKTEFSFEDSIRDTIQYMRTLPAYHMQNALHFYGLT